MTFELVNKKRKPIKRYTTYALLTGILIIVTVALARHLLNEQTKVVLMILSACLFIVSLFIFNYSFNFKNPIGKISFYQDCIELEILEKTEIIYLKDIIKVRFKLSGYEGLNTSTFFDYLRWSPSFFSYHSGMNNFVVIYTNSGTFMYEFYIRDKAAMINLKRLMRLYD
jgi:hypothetical protein